jgi:hypothetical protein
MINFTQYLRPNGRKRLVEIERSAEIEQRAKAFIDQGGCFECEELSTGYVSLTASHPYCDTGDVSIVIVANGPPIEEGVDRLVNKATQWLADYKKRGENVNKACLDT